MKRITDKEFRELVDIVYQESGIVLKDKRELVDARLASLARKKNYKTTKDIIAHLKADESGEALIELLDQVSTNLTFFFREPAHFEFMTSVLLPEIVARKKAQRSNRIRFWSAACSSGEEAYSMAITAQNYLGDGHNWDLKILATDISTKMLRKGIEGRYTRQEVMKAPASLVSRYFERLGTRTEPYYMVDQEIKNLVAFRRLNLLIDNYPFSGPFDLIVCRNVMIYFDIQTKQSLLRRFHKYLGDGGYFFSGHAESLTAYEHLFKRIQVAIYKK